METLVNQSFFPEQSKINRARHTFEKTINHSASSYFLLKHKSIKLQTRNPVIILFNFELSAQANPINFTFLGKFIYSYFSSFLLIAYLCFSAYLIFLIVFACCLFLELFKGNVFITLKFI